ncbi:hypothetical protein D3C79_731260 [compost metagenome]
MVDMAGENGLQLAACRQLQAIKRRRAEEALAGNQRLEGAVWRMNDIVRTQQHIDRTAWGEGIGTVTTQLTQFGLYRLRAGQLATDEVALANEAGHEWRQWFVIQVVRGIPLFQAAFLEHTDMIADGKGFLLIMGDQNGAGATALENVTDFMTEAPTQLHVEVGEGLVEQQQLRFGRQRAGQGHTLLLATGELVRVTFAKPAKFDQFEHLCHDLLLLWMLTDPESNVLGNGQVREQRIILEHHADPALLWCQREAGFGDDLARQLDLTLMHRLKAGNGAQGGGLAAPRRAQQATDVASVEVQVEVLDDALLAIAAGEVAQVKQ